MKKLFFTLILSIFIQSTLFGAAEPAQVPISIRPGKKLQQQLFEHLAQQLKDAIETAVQQKVATEPGISEQELSDYTKQLFYGILANLDEARAFHETMRRPIITAKQRAIHKPLLGELADVETIDPSFVLPENIQQIRQLPEPMQYWIKIALIKLYYLEQHTLEGHVGAGIQSAHFSPDGTRIVTASLDGTAKIWDADTGQLIHTIEGHAPMIRSAHFSPDGTRIVTLSYSTAKIWDADTGQLIRTLEGHVGAEIQSAHFSPDGTRIVTASLDGTAKIWDADTGQLTHTLEVHTRGIPSAHFSPDGTRIVTLSYFIAKIWDADTGQLIHTLEDHAPGIRSAHFSPDGTRIVTLSYRTAKIWDADTGQLIRTLEGHAPAGTPSAHFSPDGTRIVTVSLQDRTAKIWDTDTGQLTHTLEGHASGVESAHFSPDGTRIVTASRQDRTAKIWDTDTGQLTHTLEGHVGGITSAHFSPDGTRIVTVSRDNTAKIWGIAVTIDQVIEYIAEQALTRAAEFEKREFMKRYKTFEDLGIRER